MATGADSIVLMFFMFLFGTGIFLLFLMVFGYGLLLWMRNRGREAISLSSVLLQVSVPRDNDIKIDASEQLFASLASFRKKKRLDFFRPQPHVSFEVVGTPGNIRFYISVPLKLQDFVEKQINGAYPDAEIVPVNDPAAKSKDGTVIGGEYSIFSQSGKVS
jgi:hypothetical protein